MTTELGRARYTDPDTSHLAAQSVDVTKLEGAVLDALKAAPDGLTSEELSERLGLSLVTVSPRLRPLVNKYKVYSNGDKRRNRSGRSALIWRAK